MTDFVGKAINIGDRVAYFRSTQSGGIARETYEVKGFTKKCLIVHSQGDFGRNHKYVDPKNCVVYKESEHERETFDSVEVSSGIMKGFANKHSAYVKLGEMLIDALREKGAIQIEEDQNVYRLSANVFFKREEENESNQSDRTDTD